MFFIVKPLQQRAHLLYIKGGVVRQLAEREEQFACLFIFRMKLETFKIEVF